MQGAGACACLAVATGVRPSSRVQERASLTSAEAAPSPNRGSFARTVCVVREVDAIPLELYRLFLDRVVARFEPPAPTCVLAHVRLNMVAVLPDASR